MSGKQKHTYCLLQYALAQTAFERLIYLLVAYSFVVFVRRCCKHRPGKRTCVSTFQGERPVHHHRHHPETERDKVIFLKDLDIKIEDKDSNEQVEKFMKLNENSELYKAQLKISAITDIKPNAYEMDYGTDHLKLRSLARIS